MNILLLSAYHARSHAYWAEQLQYRLPEFNWRQLSLSPRYFNWRIRGNPLSWLGLADDIADFHADLIVATSMVDLATLRGLQPKLAHIPALVYCHENQFAYPQSDSAPTRLEPLMVNLYSALSADCLCFNSAFNQNSFLVGVEAFLKRMPDELDLQAVLSNLQAKSRVLSVPLKPMPGIRRRSQPKPDTGEPPIILWNHRWEFDKGPEQLLAAVRVFQAAGERVRWAIVGESFRKRPAAFDRIEAMAEQGDIELYRWGFIENEDDYRQLLSDATLVLSTALHDFQGLAIQEAVLAGACPLVPDRLAYPQWFGQKHRYGSCPDQSEQEAGELLASYRALKSVGWPGVDLSALCGEALITEWREQLLQTVAHGRPGAGG
mgnify:CR=1 FL=1